MQLNNGRSIFLRRQDVEERLCISKSFIYAHMKRGSFPAPVKISPKCVRWRRDDVERWAAEQTAEAGS